MSNYIYTDGERFIRISNVPTTEHFTKMHWHMHASEKWKIVPGGSADITIHWNRIASVITGWCPPSFAQFMDGFERGYEAEGQTTSPEVFLQAIEQAIEKEI